MQENEENTQNKKNFNQSSFSIEEINSKIKTKGNMNRLTENGITMTYVHKNNQNTQYFGSQFGHDILMVNTHIILRKFLKIMQI